MDPPDVAVEAEADPALYRQAHERSRAGDGGEHAASLSKAGTTVNVTARGATESSPLLGRRSSSDGSPLPPRRPSSSSSPALYDFSHLPWHRRPSIWWVLGPFFIMACAFGGIITPKMNLFLELICREYISDRVLHDPNFVTAPVNFNGGNNTQCRIPEVQSRVAQFTLWGNIISGLLASFMSPRLGALSDRMGRTRILVITSVGTILGEIITIFAATYPETFPIWVLYFSFAFDGMTGSFVVAMALANSYATDCTAPARRNVVFGYFHSCLFSGIAIGPILAGYVVEATGRIVVVFYILTAVHLSFALFVGFCVPESLSKERRELAQETHRKRQLELGTGYEWRPSLQSLNLIQGLKILWPTGPGTSPALRRNLATLATVDTVCFGVAMGSMQVVIIYTNYAFGWGTFESGRFLTIANSCRVFALLVVLPGLTRLARGSQSPEALAKQKNTGADLFDVTIIRVAIFFDTLGYVGYSLARTGSALTVSACIAAIGGIGSPTLQAAMTKHVHPQNTGRLLGAIGQLHSLARVVAPTVFNAIYSATVGKFTQTVFVCLAATFGVAFTLSWFVRPHVYANYDEDGSDSAIIDDGSEADATRA